MRAADFPPDRPPPVWERPLLSAPLAPDFSFSGYYGCCLAYLWQQSNSIATARADGSPPRSPVDPSRLPGYPGDPRSSDVSGSRSTDYGSDGGYLIAGGGQTVEYAVNKPISAVLLSTES